MKKKINFQKASLEQLKNVFHKKHQLFVHQPVINRYRCQNFPIERLAERVSKILDKAFQDAIELQLKEFTTVTLQYRSKVGNEGVFSLRAYGASFVDQLLVSIPYNNVLLFKTISLKNQKHDLARLLWILWPRTNFARDCKSFEQTSS